MMLAKDWLQPIDVDLNCGEEAPVELILEVSFTVSKCQNKTLVDVADRIWDGAIKSDLIHIAIVEPKGVDKEAYEAFNHSPLGAPWQELIKKYPTSIYAGYQFKYLRWYLPSGSGSAEETVEFLTSPDYLKKHPLIIDPFNADSGIPTLPSRQAVKDRIRLFSEYLNAHPDFPDRERLEEFLAQAYLIDGRYQGAFESYDWLAKHATNKSGAEHAEKMKAAMVKKGLVAASK
jgi:hypothetical protein